MKNELKRIFVCSLLAGVLLLLSVFFDGPVTVLGWALFVAGFVCLIYVVVAVRYLLKHSRSQQRDT